MLYWETCVKRFETLLNNRITPGHRGNSTTKALPDVLLHFWPLDVCARTRLVSDGDGRVGWLALFWLLLGCIEVLGHAGPSPHHQEHP